MLLATRNHPESRAIPMQMSDLIKPEHVIAALPATDKMQVLNDLARAAAAYINIDAQKILASLLAREELGSSGVGKGVAVPHARIDGLKRYFGLFARLEPPIDFSAVDSQPVDLLFVLLLPATAKSDHLAALACVSRRLRDREVDQQLRAAAGSPALYNLLIGSTVQARS
jgi:PTS system nitrogen regulatory IIA component